MKDPETTTVVTRQLGPLPTTPELRHISTTNKKDMQAEGPAKAEVEEEEEQGEEAETMGEGMVETATRATEPI